MMCDDGVFRRKYLMKNVLWRVRVVTARLFGRGFDWCLVDGGFCFVDEIFGVVDDFYGDDFVVDFEIV